METRQLKNYREIMLAKHSDLGLPVGNLVAPDRVGESVSLMAAPGDDLSRDVYGLFGIPIDASDRESVLRKIAAAAKADKPFLLSTPNVNFIAESQRDPKFRESLLQSDHCCADGMPIVWISRLLGLPIKQRVSGSDLFEMLRADRSSSRPLKVFLFGGSEGVAETVCKRLNEQPSGIRCVGWFNPGFGTVEEMSEAKVIDMINASGADLLAVFLSAAKAQFWLHQNHNRLRIPVRGQFGATINYQAGTVRRAPELLQRLGLEWLWRIKEEPYLWRRYGRDGLFLLTTLVTRILPIAASLGWRRFVLKNRNEGLKIENRKSHGLTVLGLNGYATAANVKQAMADFRNGLAEGSPIYVDLTKTQAIDPRFFGLLLMLRRLMSARGQRLGFIGVTSKTKRIFRLNGFDYMLAADSNTANRAA
ncbi:MAG TPA: WecB/TagA/CpsF family glycosyltransferase [Bryobacteraceae bacterium]|nr:WecB/TagA/CpsF family glycosyltransferase [Bryobacteraceae bacterium]